MTARALAEMPSPPVVVIDKLWSIFGQGAQAFAVHQDLDLTVQRGEMLSIVGGSGTGKTVLLRQILGLLQPGQGTVTTLGRPAAELCQPGAAARVGMLFQQGALYSAFNVLDNIGFALREQGTLPDAMVDEAAMIKRVALARALIMDPPLLLLDEPTAGLDPTSSDEFCALLRALHADLGLTMIMVTHDLDTLFALSSRVAVLADKRVIVTGAPLEVAQYAHPFIRTFFQGERGRRAMAPAPVGGV